MGAEAKGLVHDGDTVIGVHATDASGPFKILADLTIACDGRHSVIRTSAGLDVERRWTCSGSAPENPPKRKVSSHASRQEIMVTLDRGTYWQCAYVIPKGRYDAVKARGLESFRSDVASLAPILKPGIADVKSWEDVKLLTVAVNRLKRWTRPGLLCIGDAAHAMSPVGGVGVNIAVQDAVAAANCLAAKFVHGTVNEHDLVEVQRRREFPMRITQAMQVIVQNNISAALKPGNGLFKPPLFARVVNAVPWLQGLTARFLAVGVRPEHVRSKEAVLSEVKS